MIGWPVLLLSPTASDTTENTSTLNKANMTRSVELLLTLMLLPVLAATANAQEFQSL
ncbi:MAG: hypothetical protein ACI87E_000401, partial [Mariniblastus sp.]